jgi:hypothetical protein
MLDKKNEGLWVSQEILLRINLRMQVIILPNKNNVFKKVTLTK